MDSILSSPTAKTIQDEQHWTFLRANSISIANVHDEPMELKVIRRWRVCCSLQRNGFVNLGKIPLKSVKKRKKLYAIPYDLVKESISNVSLKYVLNTTAGVWRFMVPLKGRRTAYEARKPSSVVASYLAQQNQANCSAFDNGLSDADPDKLDWTMTSTICEQQASTRLCPFTVSD
jgi:hypothetical protein